MSGNNNTNAGGGSSAGAGGGPSGSSAVAPKRLIPMADWEAKMNAVHVKKSDLNRLVMDYLVIEGYKDAAQCFVQEANMAPTIDLDSIENRMNIRNAVQTGHIEAAIEMVNDLDPEILDTNASLYFTLQRQRLIEYIRQGEIQEALEFATEELAPRGEENPEFLKELEKTMGLLALDQASLEASDLLSPQQRSKTAGILNAAILTAQSQPKDPKLPAIIRTVLWAQEQLMEKGVFTPQIKDLRSGRLEDVRDDIVQQVSSTMAGQRSGNTSQSGASGSNSSANARRRRGGNSGGGGGGEGGAGAAGSARNNDRERERQAFLVGEMEIVGS